MNPLDEASRRAHIRKCPGSTQPGDQTKQEDRWYGFTDRAGFAMFDLPAGPAIDFPGDVFVPHLSGENRF